MAPVCVFDVNETLLDLAGLDGQFELVEAPDLVVADLDELADRLLA